MTTPTATAPTSAAVRDRLAVAVAALDRQLIELRRVHVTAETRDKRIKLALDHAGHLVSLTLADDIMSAYTEEKLSQTLTNLAGRARAAAFARHYEISDTTAEQFEIARAMLADPASEMWDVS